MERWITLAALLLIHSSVVAIEVVEAFCVVVACKLPINTRLYTLDWLSDKNLSLRFALSLRLPSSRVDISIACSFVLQISDYRCYRGSYLRV